MKEMRCIAFLPGRRGWIAIGKVARKVRLTKLDERAKELLVKTLERMCRESKESCVVGCGYSCGCGRRILREQQRRGGRGKMLFAAFCLALVHFESSSQRDQSDLALSLIQNEGD